jgi:hypothetical protein
MSAVSVIAIYKICDFNLVFKLSTSTNPSTVVSTNLFPANCKIHSFDAPTCFGCKPQPYLGGYITGLCMKCIMRLVTWKLWIVNNGVIPKLMNQY